ncbi:hypothetical protein OSB04_013092 [Centaurea solstitialis]|uniref:Uncharacterized protein n=1 Tax=Centaurea solstitialis TaxID=347529 RepID=A0AA38TCL3_9ASTR|nr:hypothetical protein OSB04_013092 [Centaurea solstitialis]
MSDLGLNLEKFLIPLEEINRATKNFSPETQIGDGGFGMVYKGQLSESWENRMAAIKRLGQKTYQEKDEFLHELKMISRFNHRNIIPFLGYCDEGDEMIIVFEYATNGSLDLHLEDPDKMGCMTWAQRLKICLGAATGLNYLHSGLGEDNRVIHRDVKSANILLDDDIEAKIGDFGLSRFGPRNQPNTQLYTKVAGTHFYLDPIYNASDILRKESDVYSFGVVMFEMLSGMAAYQESSFGDDVPRYLINRVRLLADRYSVDRLNELIDPKMKDHIDIPSSDIFIQTAYQCISLDVEKRPTMDRIIDRIKDALENQEQRDASTINIQSDQYQSTMSSSGLNLENFLIPLAEIKRATKNFSSKTQIGAGGFGNVYRGQLSERWQNRMAAIKRLGQDSFQGAKEFRNELKLISTFHHQNIIGFIGYCVEDNEIIIVLEYAINGSLDHYLGRANKNRCLTWAQRLKICLGAASGLNYLHLGLEDDSKVIHVDPKSSNIFLDDNMEAKVCDFGTRYYIDPIYEENGILGQHSDVYTFGVVLFEMLSGMLAYDESNVILVDDEGPRLIKLVRQYYDDEPEKLIDPRIRNHIVIGSFDTFKEIAYQCISLKFTERPTMDAVVKRMKKALNIQETGPTLIECLMKNIGFSEGKPVAAFTIYKCLLHWKSFRAEQTTIFDRLIYMFDSTIEKEDTNDNMAYWLSNVSNLLVLIHGSVKLNEASSIRVHSFPSSKAAAAIEVVQAVGKHTALSFKQKLSEYVEYMYEIIRDNLIKELGCLLTLCIQAPRTPRRVPKPESNHWQGIVDCLDALLNTLRKNFVPPIIVGKIFTQLFSYINIQVFHSILLYRECCTFSNGKYVEAGLKALQQWCWQTKEEYVSLAMEKLMHLRQAVTLLVISSIEKKRRKDLQKENINSFILQDYSSKR